MKKLIAAAGLGAAAIGSLVGAGTASADTAGEQNYEFIQSLNDNGVYVFDVDVALNYGRGICTRLANGSDGAAEQERVFIRTPELSRNGAYNYVGSAAEAFCPQFVNVSVYPAVN